MDRKLVFVISLAVAVSLGTAQAGVITLSASGQGWIRNDGVGNDINSANNYLAGWCAPGDCGGYEFRNFFLFNVPSFSGAVLSSRLLLNTWNILTPDASETYQVTSIPAVFGFADLGTGALYGSRTYLSGDANQLLAINLNGAALAAILPGSVFRVGGRVTTLSGQTQLDELVFGSSQNAQQLEITTSDSAVPEPATWLLAGSCLAIAALWRRRPYAGR